MKDQIVLVGAHPRVVGQTQIAGRPRLQLNPANEQPVRIGTITNSGFANNCSVPGCTKCSPGQSDYCRICGNRNSNHRASNCPSNRRIFL